MLYLKMDRHEAINELRDRGIQGDLDPQRYKQLLIATGVPKKQAALDMYKYILERQRLLER